MRYFDKDAFLEQTKQKLISLQDAAMQCIRDGNMQQAEIFKAQRNIFICYRTTYSAHWYDRTDEEALRQFINYDMTVQTGHIAKTQAEMDAVMQSDLPENVKEIALAKHRGYMELLAVFNACLREENGDGAKEKAENRN